MSNGKGKSISRCTLALIALGKRGSSRALQTRKNLLLCWALNSLLLEFYHARQAFRVRDLWHCIVMTETGLRTLKTDTHLENGLSLLRPDHITSCKGLAIANTRDLCDVVKILKSTSLKRQVSSHLVDNRQVVVSREHKICVKRVHNHC
jgi:hypothetical protein